MYWYDPSKFAWLGADESLIWEMILMLVNEFLNFDRGYFEVLKC